MPLIFFDKLIYDLSANFQLDFLPFRMWIGMWTTVFLLLFLAFGISAYIRYLTRFSLEIFLILTSFCAVYNTASMLSDIKIEHPVLSPYFQEHSCVCLRYIDKIVNRTDTSSFAKSGANRTDASGIVTQQSKEYLNVSLHECILNNGILSGDGCDSGVYFLSMLLTFCTLLVVSLVAYLRLTGLFPRSVSSGAWFFFMIACLIFSFL